jgi:thymidine phosphorylase
MGFATIDVEQLGWAIIDMGGGRKRVGDAIDHSVGLEMLVRLGDRVERGQPLVNVFARAGNREAALAQIRSAIQIAKEPCAPTPLIAERITEVSS